MHTIRLRRPWEKQLVGSDIVSRVDVPESISDSPVTESTFLYRRRFNQPTGLDDAAKVHLRISGWSGQIDSVTLNGSPLRIAGDSIEVEVTSLLQSTKSDRHSIDRYRQSVCGTLGRSDTRNHVAQATN